MEERQFAVRAPDGTRIAVWTTGSGPPLVLVHGSIADHTTFATFVETLSRMFTTYAVDRRGFGASGDEPPYALEREFQDVEAVAAEVADRAERPVALFAHSYGANCALGASAPEVARAVLYEPSLGLRYPPGVIDRVEAAVTEGRREDAILIVLREVLALTDEEIDGFRSNPLWPTRIASAHTIPRECRVEESWPLARIRRASVPPTLLLSGSESVPELREATARAAAAVPGSRVRVLHGHAHFAHRTDPEFVAGLIAEFARS